MRNLKKFLALVLAMMMALSLMVTVNAATSSKDLNLSDSESVSSVFLEDIQVLTGMEVIKGYPDGSFKPKTEINRHQMATFIYRMTTGDTGNLKDVYLSEIAAEKFSDVKAEDSYAGYIGYCYVNGYIAGFPDGSFKPMNKVTGYQALVMILRAMGYNNPADNFTGSDWQVLAASRARMNNLLVNIDKSVYSNTFSQPAPRELVAEMVFQGLIQPQVTYTSAFGYQRYGMEGGVLSSTLNPTLGYVNYGLTNHKGIVVGNQGSGEKVTKVGFSLDVDVQKGINIGDQITGNTSATDWTVMGSVTNANFNDKLVPDAYYYDSSLAVNAASNGVDGNVTLSFNWESDLKLFNHAVDVWYDYRGTSTTSADLTATGGFNAGSVTFRDNLKTYAMFDRVKNVSVNTATWDVASGTNTGIDNVFGATADTLYNYAFAPMQRGAAGVYTVTAMDGTMPTRSAASPIQANNGNDTYSTTETTDLYPLYLGIDNTGNGHADVVISLNLTMTKVVQDNNTQAPLTTGVLSQNGATTVNTTGYFDLWDQKTPVNGTPKYSDIADAALLNSDGTTLGKYVSAMTITGTTDPQNDGTQDATISAPGAANVDGTEGNTGTTGINSTYYYQVNELTKYVTATMVKYDQNTDKVWVTVNGQPREIERSVFALATDGSFQANEHVFAPRNAGTFRFYLDEEGKWLFWEVDTQTSEFVYGTYVNYTTNEFGGLFNYPFVYVNAAGEKNQTGYVTGLDMNGVVNATNTQTYVGDMNNAGYTAIQLPKRTNTGDNSSGFVPGAYVGYTMTKNDKNEVTLDADVTSTNFRQADATNFGNSGATNGGTTTINANSVALTAHPVTDEGNLFLTNRTKFVIVDGAGTETQKVDIYNGLAELLGNNQSVTIDAVTGLTATTAGSFLDHNLTEVGTNPYEMVYFSTEEDPYSQNYYQMDKHIDTVFIPRVLVKWTANPGSGNLYFVGDNSHGLIDAGTDATQFTFHQGDATRTLWIAGQFGGANDRATLNANVVGNAANKDTFYWLFDTGAKAKDGEPIYTINTTAQTPASAGSSLIGYYYDGSDVGNTTAGNRTAANETAITLGHNTGTTYLATTRNSQVAYIGGRDATDLYNVQNATILNLNKAYTINSLGDLNEASSNTSNLGIAVSCVLDEGKFIANIYVNFVSGT